MHSAKDMTSSDAEGLVWAPTSSGRIRATRSAVPAELRPGMRVGTASVGAARNSSLEPELSIEPLRGNIDTRLRKRAERGLDAVVLAACGLDRLGLAARSGTGSSPRRCCPRPVRERSRCRCATGEEELVARGDDCRDAPTVEAERAVIFAIGGGCLAPVPLHDVTT